MELLDLAINSNNQSERLIPDRPLDPFAAEIAKAVWAMSPIKPEFLRPEPQPVAVVASDDKKAVSNDDAVYTVDEICERNRISRASLYKLWRVGTGPKYFKIGASTRVTREAEREWQLASEKV